MNKCDELYQILKELKTIRMLLERKMFKRQKLRYDTKTQEWIADDE